MEFSKFQATGNDFILLDARSTKQDWAELAQTMCRRHFGVGADGLITVHDSEIADLKMRIFNPDGSEAEACGNGLRCFAKYAIEGSMVGKTDLTIETASGIRQARACVLDGEVKHAEVSMGVPKFRAEEIPADVDIDTIPILGYSLELAECKLTLSLVSMGNPHAVSFTPVTVGDFPLSTVGPEVEKHPVFPHRTNFEIANVLNRNEVKARVWERGVGETLACGSGACAIAVIARLLNYVESQVDIMLPGGVLSISWDGAGEVLLSGPVARVFTGEYSN